MRGHALHQHGGYGSVINSGRKLEQLIGRVVPNLCVTAQRRNAICHAVACLETFDTLTNSFNNSGRLKANDHRARRNHPRVRNPRTVVGVCIVNTNCCMPHTNLARRGIPHRPVLPNHRFGRPKLVNHLCFAHFLSIHTVALLLSRSQEVVHLAEIHSAMAQEVVGGDHMEEKVWQRMVLQIGFT